MASSFFGLYVQRDALQLAQKSLDITGHNITNIGTEGYARQRLDVCSVANTKGSINYNTGISLAGQGADAIGVTHTRDKLLDAKVRKYSSELCDIGSKSTVLADIEDIIDDVENETTGLTAIMNKWSASFQSFSATGADRTDLANICINSARSVINVLRNFDTRIKDTQISTEKDIDNTTTRVNFILKEMASLNKQIEDGYVQMNDVYVTNTGYQTESQYGPLELKDQFNLLADELSEYINITVTETTTGSFTVETGAKLLVEKDKYARVDVKFAPDKEDIIEDAAGNPLTSTPVYLEFKPAYDENGNKIVTYENGKFPEGTKLLLADGTDTGLTADGNGGYVNAAGDAVNVYFTKEDKFYNDAGDELTDPPAGTKLYTSDGTDTGLIADGSGGYVNAAGEKVTVLGFDNVKYQDKKGNDLTLSPDGNITEGTKLYFANGEDSKLTADGNGGYLTEDGKQANVYVVGESVFKDKDGNIIENWGTINDGSIVYDENGNKITVRGNFDAETIEYNFAELYISSANTDKGWTRALRELTTELQDAGLGDMIVDLNSLIESGNVEEAFRKEEELMAAAAKSGVKYDPIFTEHIAAAEKPEYAISFTEETDTLSGGSLKGLFDMYNGEGWYSGLRGNSYKGIKYYEETYRSLAKTMVTNFNALYDEYNNEAKAKAGDDAVSALLKANPAATEEEKNAARKKAEEEYVPFKLFEFDGAETVANLVTAKTWNDNPLRCVHPQGTEEGDYNYDELDNAFLNKILSAFDKKYDFGDEPLEYTFSEFVTNCGNTIGSQLEYELSDFESTTVMFNSVSDAREEVMGVSMDEEGVNMMNYQKWYNAISRMITAMDQCLEKLINGTGVVGT